MNPQDLAEIFNGLSTADQVEFLAAIKPNSFLLSDEIAYNASSNKQEQDVLEAIHGINSLLLEYHLNFGTNRLVRQAGCHRKNDINGIFFNGFFLSDDMEPFNAIDWTRVEVQHG